MNEIPLKPKNDQNNLETKKLTKIPHKPKKWPKYLETYKGRTESEGQN